MSAKYVLYHGKVMVRYICANVGLHTLSSRFEESGLHLFYKQMKQFYVFTSIPPEVIRKPPFLWCFQGYRSGTLVENGLISLRFLKTAKY